MDNPSSADPVVLKQVGEIHKTFTEHMQHQWTGKTVDGSKYVRSRRIVHWMRATDTSSTATNGSLLLEHVYEAARNPLPLFCPVEWEQISDGNYIIMFSFLVDLGYGHLIDVFRRFTVQDNYLHRRGNIIKEDMLKLSFKDSAELQSFMVIFESRRWEFCPVEFYQDIDIDLDDGLRVLPFCRRQRITHKGVTADLYEVAVEEDFVNENLREIIECTKYVDRDFGPCYRFALKSYSEEWEDIYNSEINAFHRIRYEENMIKYLGTVKCTQCPQTLQGPRNKEQRRSYNILLEYGEDDLNEYFFVHNPPVLDREIIDFWGNLFQIVDALQRVHNLEQKRKDGTTHWYIGCHADVTPDNILRVQGSFKLADFGFATFVPCGVGNLSPVGGTQTYGAPEFFQKDRMASGDDDNCIITNTIDTWSIACVLSVAVTWVTLGYQGIKQFETVRQAAIMKIKSHPEASTTHDLFGDIFHDGFGVLKDVTDWHHFLRQVMRKSDPVSSRILDLIDEEVLGQYGDSRLTSAVLYQKLNKLLATAKKMNEQIAESIIKCIVSLDKTAPSTMKEYSDQRRKEAERLIQPEGDRSKHSNKSASLTNIVPTRVAHRQVLERWRKR
ncbi:kinase-like domain-containing protein [Xylaria sp. FL1777]|nr:kinase-like domain-containing protein [Xylaria sp. FL1777]